MKNPLKTLLHRAGLDVRLVRNVERHGRLLAEDRWRASWQFLANYRVRSIVDIGANTGQFLTMIHGLCPDAAVHCFEPVADCFAELEKTAAAIPGARAYRLAIGDRAGTAVMNRSEFTPCSSLLTPNDRLRREIPEAARIRPETVEIATLDGALAGISLEPDLLLKIDVQGHELAVLRGAGETLRRARLVALEVTFYAQYEGQPLFDDVYRAMRDRGFVYRGNAGQHDSPLDHRFCYADAVFEREP